MWLLGLLILENAPDLSACMLYAQIKALRFIECSRQPFSILTWCNKDNGNQIKKKKKNSLKVSEKGPNKLQYKMWGCLLTCRAFYPEKCSSSPRYIFIAGSLAAALPRFSYFMQSTPARKQKNKSHLIILGFVLCFATQHIRTCWDFTNV